jgi:hypothetical protein
MPTIGSNKMKKIQLAIMVAVLVIAAQARASLFDIVFDYSDNGVNIAGNGWISATANGDGSYTAVGGSLRVTEAPPQNLSIAGTFGLLANPSPPSAVYSPSGFFIYDNQVFPGKTPYLDTYGLLFTGNGLEINLWGNGQDATAFYTIYGNNGANYNGTATLTAVPEPTTMVAGAGALGLALLGIGRARRFSVVRIG